ncbi:MAG: hypothetical protein Q7J55_02415 [bacterium]|nr:hypothetical protein [bacterium]
MGILWTILTKTKKIRIGGHWYKVIFPYIFKEDKQLWGQTDHATQEMRISDQDGAGNKLTQSKVEEIFTHEILHGVDYIYNGDKLDEDTIKRMSEGLYQVLVDNFKF